MQILEEINKLVMEAKDILCNKCGLTLRSEYGNFEGIVDAYVEGGYGSKLGDSIGYKFDVCESCLDEFMKTFKIPAEIRNFDEGRER